MAYRNKTYICFDGDTDMHYYRLMCAWKQNDGIAFDFYNAHDLNSARDTSTEDTIKRKLRDRISNTKVMIVLIGEKTRYLYKFVRWEMEQAISLNIPIIAVNLNGKRFIDADRCPPVISSELVIHTSFNAAILQHALENWPANYTSLKREGKSGPYYYNDEIYKRLGL